MRQSILVILFIGFFLPISTFANQYNTDTARINSIIRQSKAILFKDPQTAKPLVDTIELESSKIKYQFGLYSAANFKGILAYINSNYNQSIIQYNKALTLADKNDAFQTIRLYNNIGLSLRALNLKDSAIYFTEKACNLSAQHGMTDFYEHNILDLAMIYLNKNDYIKASKYYKDIIDYTLSSTDTGFLIKAYSALGMFYLRINNLEQSTYYFNKAIKQDSIYDEFNFLGENYGNLGLLYNDVAMKYDSAIYFFKKSIEEAEPYKKNKIAFKATINIGNAFLDRNILDSAFFYYQKAYEDSLINVFTEDKSAVYTNIGMYHLRNNDHQKARHFLNEGLKLSQQYELLLFQRNAHRQLYTLDSIQGNARQALYHFRQFHLISESLKLEEVNNQMAIMEYEKYIAKEKYNNDLLKKENENQNQEIIIQRAIIGLVVLTVLILLIIILMVSNNRRKIRKLNQNLQISNTNLEELNKDLHFQKNEMKALLKSKDRFVSILGHDLKNPFTGLLGLLELIDLDWDEMADKDKRDGIKQLYTSSHQTYQLLEELLDWGKTQQGLIKVVNSKFHIMDLFEEVQNIYKLQIREKDLDIHISIPDNYLMNSDKKLCSQILQNLVGNAIKYSQKGGQIQLIAKKKNHQLSICVNDQGIGIPKDKIDLLFKLDSNYNRPGTQNEKSTGMGLILCKEYATILDANISVESTEGKGSTFCLELKPENPEQ